MSQPTRCTQQHNAASIMLGQILKKRSFIHRETFSICLTELVDCLNGPNWEYYIAFPFIPDLAMCLVPNIPYLFCSLCLDYLNRPYSFPFLNRGEIMKERYQKSQLSNLISHVWLVSYVWLPLGCLYNLSKLPSLTWQCSQNIKVLLQYMRI